MKVTLHEVAARANVSIATVSRALNGLAVSVESRERVEKAVAELGYVANQAARALRSERTLTVGLIFSDLRNMLGVELVDALAESLEAGGYSLLISTARGDADRYDVLMRRFLERRVDALFCIRPQGRGVSLAAYESAGIPVIALFASGGAFSGLPTLRPSFSEPAKAVAEHLRALGHRRVACLTGAATGPMTAIVETLTTQAFDVRSVALDDGHSARDIVAGLKAGAASPTALVAPDPAVRALRAAIAAAGLKVPEDLSLVALCDLAGEAHYRKAGITTVTVDPQRMGRAAAAAMLDWLSGTRPADRTRVQAGDLAPRASTGQARA
jgi:LacI family transcriptional regulator